MYNLRAASSIFPNDYANFYETYFSIDKMNVNEGSRVLSHSSSTYYTGRACYSCVGKRLLTASQEKNVVSLVWVATF